MEQLRGRVAVVTGAAGGIGLALARRFGEEGMQVVLSDVEESALTRATQSLVEEGHRAIGVTVQGIRDKRFWLLPENEHSDLTIRTRAESMIARKNPDYMVQPRPLVLGGMGEAGE